MKALAEFISPGWVFFCFVAMICVSLLSVGEGKLEKKDDR